MTVEKKIVVFNGPIECGKDTIVDRLVASGKNAKKMEMKAKLIDLTIAIYGVSKEWWEENYTRLGKEIPRLELDGRSMREALIHTSETVVKPNYGKDYFGRMTRKALDATNAEWHFYADGGFPEELVPLGEGLSPLLIRIHRYGYVFDPSKDSRNYIKDEDLPDNWKSVDVNNVNGQFETFVCTVTKAMKDTFGKWE